MKKLFDWLVAERSFTRLDIIWIWSIEICLIVCVVIPLIVG